MKFRRIALSVVVLLVVSSLTWNGADLVALGEPSVPNSPEGYQLLVNPGMEQGFLAYGAEFHGVPCQVAVGWERFWEGASPLTEPCWMDARVFAHQVMNTDWVEKIEGVTSQVIVSTEPYVAGIYQRVTGLTPGLPYGFHAAMMTIFQTSYGPAQHGMMVKHVGMDPTGGTDPNADTVVWSEPQDLDYGWDVERRTAVVAQTEAMTVFVRVTSPYSSGGWPYVNQSFLDSAILARTATVSAVSPEYTLEPTFTVRWDNAQASIDATIRWYDVQWMDEADGQWVDWLLLTEQTQATFAGELGHTYRFRARAWQRYPNGAHLYSPYEPSAGSVTSVAVPQLVGRVFGNGPHTLTGARVSILDTGFETVSRSDGSYQMWTEPMVDPVVIVSYPPWLSPDPAYGVTFGWGDTVELTWSLRPSDDAVTNGGFEADLDGWDALSEGDVTPETATDPVHTGHQSVLLQGQTSASTTTGVEQTVELARSWSPNLSFWYLPESTDDDDLFEVTLTVLPDAAARSSLTFEPVPDAEGWQHRWYSLGIDDAYFTGTVTITFTLRNDGDESPTTVYLDEVSIGRTPGGPYRAYLPLVRE